MQFSSPLVFAPIFRSYLWGGDNLQKILHKSLPDSGIWAESWEIVDHGADQSVVTSGEFKGSTLHQLIEQYRDSLLGRRSNSAYPAFPLLLKYLDCNNVLSVQVHPDDAYALKMNPPDLGKTEAWYIVDAKPNSVLYAGLKKGVSKAMLEDAVSKGTTEACLHTVHPRAGDCIFIPAGTVHALGSGLIVAEIQQASDTTFRLFDWNRVDANGKSRPLHIEQALDVIDFERGPVGLIRQSSSVQSRTNLVTCDKFVLDRLAAGEHQVMLNDSFAIVTVPEGSAEIQSGGGSLHLTQGQTTLLPASIERVNLVVHDAATVLLASLP